MNMPFQIKSFQKVADPWVITVTTQGSAHATFQNDFNSRPIMCLSLLQIQICVNFWQKMGFLKRTPIQSIFSLVSQCSPIILASFKSKIWNVPISFSHIFAFSNGVIRMVLNFDLSHSANYYANEVSFQPRTFSTQIKPYRQAKSFVLQCNTTENFS